MRIAMFSWETLHSHAVGGIAAHVTELAAALERRGHEVHVFTRPGYGSGGVSRIDGVWYHYCPHNLSRRFRGRNPGDVPFVRLALFPDGGLHRAFRRGSCARLAGVQRDGMDQAGPPGSSRRAHDAFHRIRPQREPFLGRHLGADSRSRTARHLLRRPRHRRQRRAQRRIDVDV